MCIRDRFVTVTDSFQYIGDRTVSSCLRCERICELVLTQLPNDVTIGNHVANWNWVGQDKTHFTPHFETGQNCFEIFSRRQSCLVTNSVHTANTDKTRHDTRCELAITSSELLIASILQGTATSSARLVVCTLLRSCSANCTLLLVTGEVCITKC